MFWSRRLRWLKPETPNATLYPKPKPVQTLNQVSISKALRFTHTYAINIYPTSVSPKPLNPKRYRCARSPQTFARCRVASTAPTFRPSLEEWSETSVLRHTLRPHSFLNPEPLCSEFIGSTASWFDTDLYQPYLRSQGRAVSCTVFYVFLDVTF